MKRSRLRRLHEQETERNLYLYLGGIIAIILFLLIFGMPLLVNLSMLVTKKGGDTTNKQSSQYIAPPTLDIPYEATNSAKISVSGTATSGDKVKLYVNDDMVDMVDVEKDNSFTFDAVVLKEGKNVLKAVALDDKNAKSDFSESAEVTYLKKAPTLTIDSPNDGQTFSHDQNKIEVKGKTDPDVKVTINGFWAITHDDGSFSYSGLQLQNGDNMIKIVAEDKAGNKTEQTRKVTYNQ